jgi:hypothetical protein
MWKNPTVQYAALGGGLLLLVLVVWWQFRAPGETPADEFARIALSAASEDEREAAAVRLAQHPSEPRVLMRKVLAESNSTRVKGPLMISLGGLKDWASKDPLLAAMESGDEALRAQASTAVTLMLDYDYGFAPGGDQKQRQAAMKVIRQQWPIREKLYQQKFGSGQSKEPSP